MSFNEPNPVRVRQLFLVVYVYTVKYVIYIYCIYRVYNNQCRRRESKTVKLTVWIPIRSFVIFKRNFVTTNKNVEHFTNKYADIKSIVSKN